MVFSWAGFFAAFSLSAALIIIVSGITATIMFFDGYFEDELKEIWKFKKWIAAAFVSVVWLVSIFVGIIAPHI